jgi:quinol monooxygenase YgiN
MSATTKTVTLINVFLVEPENQTRLIDLLTKATETSVRYAPGFISATLHRGLDGRKVTMVAQWQSMEAYNAMRANAASDIYLKQALAIAQFDPGMYEVVQKFSPVSETP